MLKKQTVGNAIFALDLSRNSSKDCQYNMRIFAAQKPNFMFTENILGPKHIASTIVRRTDGGLGYAPVASAINPDSGVPARPVASSPEPQCWPLTVLPVGLIKKTFKPY